VGYGTRLPYFKKPVSYKLGTKPKINTVNTLQIDAVNAFHKISLSIFAFFNVLDGSKHLFKILGGGVYLQSICDSDSRWAAGQSIRPQPFVIIVGVQFIEPEDIIKLRV